MRWFPLLPLACLAGCSDPAPSVERSPPVEWSPRMQAVADGNNRFAFDLYRKLAEKPGNVFFSPFSAHAALSMTATGAAGATRDGMVKVLHLPSDPADALAAGDLSRCYARDGPGYELAAANAIWGQKGPVWKPEFLAAQKDRFGAAFREADFTADPDGERGRINAWAEEHTRGRIKDLLPPNTIDKLTVMVLANAVYFKGEWAERFDPKRTQPAPFTLADGSRQTVQMMAQEGGFRRYSEGRSDFVPGQLAADKSEPVEGFDVAELPYKGGKLSMVVVVPFRHDGLPELEKRAIPEAVSGWLAKAHPANGGLYLPRLKMETDYLLNGPLRDCGMGTAFRDGSADFSGMTGKERPFISAVVQKAFVEVNEEGTEAAAATAVVMQRSVSASVPTPPFRADRLFLIRDAEHGTILFLGRYEKPAG